MKHLIYAYGNPGRGDDNVAHVVADALQTKNLPMSTTIKHNFQLNLEDVGLMADHDRVLFIDASIEAEHCHIETVMPNMRQIEFTNHAMAPHYLLSLCELLYGCHPDTYLLHIPGHQFDLAEQMSDRTLTQIPEAIAIVGEWLEKKAVMAQ